MATTTEERIVLVEHHTDQLFSFRTTRSPTFRFEPGQFVMLGLPDLDHGRPLLRAYSLASAPYDEHLDFFSIKVPGGPLTSRLKEVQPHDLILVGTRATGTLILANLNPGLTLWLLATGTGLAPFLSIIQDPATYERYERIVLVHSVRESADLAYAGFIEQELPKHPLIGSEVRSRLRYFPTVTRESFRNQGRITDLLKSGRIEREFDLPPLSNSTDRVMLCGNTYMLEELSNFLEARGFAHGNSGEKGHYLTERAFAPR